MEYVRKMGIVRKFPVSAYEAIKKISDSFAIVLH